MFKSTNDGNSAIIQNQLDLSVHRIRCYTNVQVDFVENIKLTINSNRQMLHFVFDFVNFILIEIQNVLCLNSGKCMPLDDF